jgi:hypothetical protein
MSATHEIHSLNKQKQINNIACHITTPLHDTTLYRCGVRRGRGRRRNVHRHRGEDFLSCDWGEQGHRLVTEFITVVERLRIKRFVEQGGLGSTAPDSDNGGRG